MITVKGTYFDSKLSGYSRVDYTGVSEYMDNIKDTNIFHEYKHDKYDASYFKQGDFLSKTGIKLNKLIETINAGKYIYALNTLNNINYQIRNAINSKNITDKIKNDLKQILTNLEKTEYLFINNINNDQIKTTMNYLEWTKNFIAALNNMDEWEKKMERAWRIT